uniref:Uncharacterized protein n=1 Tax=Cynoglossus semilaevis TaxID=244447 RepID=A0A3P8VSE3_CYNSE
MCTGPGPQWASGGDTVTVKVLSEARGSCTALEVIRLNPWTEREGERERSRRVYLTVPTVIRPDSVRFQKDFQNCKSRFWVIRSNSIPLNSGSMTYFPEVRRERAAVPENRNIFKLKKKP